MDDKKSPINHCQGIQFIDCYYFFVFYCNLFAFVFLTFQKLENLTFEEFNFKSFNFGYWLQYIPVGLTSMSIKNSYIRMEDL